MPASALMSFVLQFLDKVKVCIWTNTDWIHEITPWPAFLLAPLENKLCKERACTCLYSAALKWDGWVVLSDLVTHYSLNSVDCVMLHTATQGDCEQQQEVRMSTANAPDSRPFAASCFWCRFQFQIKSNEFFFCILPLIGKNATKDVWQCSVWDHCCTSAGLSLPGHTDLLLVQSLYPAVSVERYHLNCLGKEFL